MLKVNSNPMWDIMLAAGCINPPVVLIRIGDGRIVEDPGVIEKAQAPTYNARTILFESCYQRRSSCDRFPKGMYQNLRNKRISNTYEHKNLL